MTFSRDFLHVLKRGLLLTIYLIFQWDDDDLLGIGSVAHNLKYNIENEHRNHPGKLFRECKKNYN